MNDQAANKMLKTLEEPPPFAHLVLLTSRPADLLPTIASRCQPVRFDAPPRRGDRRAPERRTASARPPRTRARASALGDAERAPGARRRGRSRAARGGRRASRARRCATTCSGARGSRSSPSRAAAATRRRREIEAAVGRRPRAAAQEGPQARRARGAPTRPGAPPARARTGALDLALQLAGLWLRDVAVVARRAPRSSSTRPTAAPTCGPTPRAATSTACAPAWPSSTRRAPRSPSTRPRSSLLEALASRLARARWLADDVRRRRAPARARRRPSGRSRRSPKPWCATQRSSHAIEA